MLDNLDKFYNNAVEIDTWSNTNTLDLVNSKIDNTLLCDESVLWNFDKLRHWIINQNNSIWIKETVKLELANLWFEDKFSFEQLSVESFINSFKNNPYIKYYFLRKCKFHDKWKYFTLNDICREDIGFFVDSLEIDYFDENNYIDLAKDDLASIWINSVETFEHYNFQLNVAESIRDSLWFRYMLSKKFNINNIYKTNSRKSDIAHYLFEDTSERAREELINTLEEIGITNFTELLDFVYLKKSDNNIKILEDSLSLLSDYTKLYFSSLWFYVPRIRWKSWINILADLALLSPDDIDTYKDRLIDRIKDTSEIISNTKYDVELSYDIIKKLIKTNTFFWIYFYYFISEWKWLYRNFDEEMKEKICSDFWALKLSSISDNELITKIKDLSRIEDISWINLKTFINKYKTNLIIIEYFKREYSLNWISRLKLSTYNDFLTWVFNK